MIRINPNCFCLTSRHACRIVEIMNETEPTTVMMICYLRGIARNILIQVHGLHALQTAMTFVNDNPSCYRVSIILPYLKGSREWPERWSWEGQVRV